MADLLPSAPDFGSDSEQDEPRVVGVDTDDAESVLSALSSETAREILSALHEEPGAASNVADRVDTTLQNTQYHLERMSDAGLIEVAGTAYSEKGREMDVYAPADRALVVVAGREEDTKGLKSALKTLLGALIPLGIVSVVLETLLDGPFAFTPFGLASSGGASGDGGEADVQMTAETTDTAAQAASSSPGLLETLGSSPGFMFFVGGLLALVIVLAFLQYRR
jgi:DNA-binding transcriptional ArsR family regulator